METGFSSMFSLYLDSVFKNKHKLVHNKAPVMNGFVHFFSISISWDSNICGTTGWDIV